MSVLAHLEYGLVLIAAEIMTFLVCDLLRYESASDGFVTRNDMLATLINGHNLLFAIGIVFATLVAGMANTVTRFLRYRRWTVEMHRALSLAAAKALSWLFIIVVALAFTSGTTSIVG